MHAGSDGGPVRLRILRQPGGAFAPYLEITAFWITQNNNDIP
jgi:hypothetical protein